MAETIGRPGICINTIDREEILIALDNLLDSRKRDYEVIKHEFTQKEIIRPEDKFKHPALIIFEDLKKRTQMVKDRVINTPEC